MGRQSDPEWNEVGTNVVKIQNACVFVLVYMYAWLQLCMRLREGGREGGRNLTFISVKVNF